MRNLLNSGRNCANTDGAGEVVALQGFYILDLERVEVEIVQSEESN